MSGLSASSSIQDDKPLNVARDIYQIIDNMIDYCISLANENCYPIMLLELLNEQRNFHKKNVDEAIGYNYFKYDVYVTSYSCIQQKFLRFVQLIQDISELRINNGKLSDSKIIKLYIYTNILTHSDEWQMYLCGGFVRDLFNDDIENDLDIWGSYKWHHDDIINTLETYHFKLQYTEPKKCNDYMMQEAHMKINCSKLIGDQVLEFTIDLSMGGAFYHYAVDYQCNALYLYQEKITDNDSMVWKIGVRVYEPQIPKCDKHREFIYVKAGFRRIVDSQQLPHFEFVAKYRSLVAKPTFDKYCHDLFEGQRLLEQINLRISKYPPVPSFESVIRQIEQKQLLEVNYCQNLIKEHRLEHMSNKGYLLASEPSAENNH
jgi:hypothetical protein